MALYPYKPLNLPQETRILTLQPGKWDDEVICNLTHLQIESGEPYEALSYCWSKSIAHARGLDDVVQVGKPRPSPDDSTEDVTDLEPEQEYKTAKVRDLLGDPMGEYVYIQYGGPLPDGKIICDVVEMPVGGELFRAMKRLRERDEALRIWIDALCINQADMQERTEHVKVMGSIYRNASMVRIWLGDGIELERNIFRALDDLFEIIKEVQPDVKDMKTPGEAQIRCMSHPKWYKVEWYALARFLDRAWFERIWVVQELANAKQAKVHMGRHTIPWNAISRVLVFLDRYRLGEHIPHTSAAKRVMGMNDIRRMVQQNHRIPEESVPSFLENLRDFKSTIPIDKIYGMLGVLDPAVSIEVDYSKSAEQLFTDLAVRYLKVGYMTMLYHCGEPHQPSSLNLPSWVPDWTRQRWTSPLFIRELPCNAAGDTEAQLSIDAAAGTIRVRGRVIDEVHVVNDEAEIPVSQYEPEDTIAWADVDQETKSKRNYWKAQRKMKDAFEIMVRLVWPTPEDFSWESYENLWRMFVCNRYADGTKPVAGQGILWEVYMDWIFERGATDDEKDDKSYCTKIINRPLSLEQMFKIKRSMFAELTPPLDMPSFAGAQKRWCYNRRFFISAFGRYGWAVDGTRSGDLVAVLYGCKYPFLLREVGDGTYKIIGDCYIHGLMDGEALGDDFGEEDLVIS